MHFYSFGQKDSISLLSPEEAVSLALENNPVILNSSLQIDKAQLMKQASWDIDATEFKFKIGQIYSPEQDRYFELNQGFGSLLEHIYQFHMANQHLQLSKTEFEIQQRNITSEVKSAYYFWVYTYNRLSILQQQQQIFSDIARIAGLQYKNGEIDLLEKTTLLAEVAHVETQLNMLYDELDIACNKLKQLIVKEGDILPLITELTMYKINKSSDTSQYSTSILANYYRNLYEINSIAVKSKSAAFFPEISMGVINQHIEPHSGLWGWQLGLSFPLWFVSKGAELKQAKLEKEMAENEYDYQLFAIKKTIENLILELDKTFKKLLYFDQYALIQADQISETASLQLEKEEIEYIEYACQIARSISIKMEYLETLNQYNQFAIQLEFYAH